VVCWGVDGKLIPPPSSSSKKKDDINIMKVKINQFSGSRSPPQDMVVA